MTQQEFELLNVRLRGKRDYLHSTDSFMSLNCWLSNRYGSENIKAIKIKFSGINKFLPKIRVVPVGEIFIPSKDATLVADFQLVNGARHSLELVTSETKPIERFEGNESKISSSVSIEGRTSIIFREPDADLVEHAVFSSKQLHYRIFPIEPDEGAIWMVAEINIAFDMRADNWKQMIVRMDMDRGGSVTSSSILLDEVKIGSIRYIKVFT